jgi:hypothetical protein
MKIPIKNVDFGKLIVHMHDKELLNDILLSFD